ncbi:metallophosphoesterase [Barnesiella viscericola]|uniref:acid phosphatase n=2 Tax=Barnesiella viscericola TaxID=397865 RepID=W0ETI8_9BACT|nr:metallophosphoesterase [Barnesiella viscericola]AHF12848.1 acid phosphatase [Barnesiella viscericola DSM 18177]HJG88327.1 metallophosphoesterase [Barnesiella viscericola]
MKTVQFFSALLLMGAIVSVSSCKPTTDSTSSLPAEVEDNFNFIVANDLGRNGYYDQKIIAEQMGETAGEIGIEFVAAAGDIHHFEGVASVNDPLWNTNYEYIYSHPELMLDWYPVLGNHEYRGNTQAVLDYSGVSRRWCMPARYYDKSFEVGDSSSLKVVFIDTAPLIDKYHKESEESYRDVAAQDMEAQLHWIDSVLNASHETWKIVIGHHPVYAQTPKDEIERENLQQRLDPLLRKYGVDMYIAGHIHNFQHIRVPGSDVDYVVNSSASLSRKVSEIEGTQYCSPEPGFSVVSVSDKDLNLYMLDKTGHVLHTVTRTR